MENDVANNGLAGNGRAVAMASYSASRHSNTAIYTTLATHIMQQEAACARNGYSVYSKEIP